MTGNQLTYWANIERERSNRASEALKRAEIALRNEELAWSKASFEQKQAQEAALAEARNQVDLMRERIKKYGLWYDTLNLFNDGSNVSRFHKTNLISDWLDRANNTLRDRFGDLWTALTERSLDIKLPR